MIVECVGPPGSGKSFVTDRLVEELNLVGVGALAPMHVIGPRRGSAARVASKFWMATNEIARSPRAASAAARAVRRSRQQRRRDEVARLLNLLVLRALVRRARRSQAVSLFDQAAITELWSVGYAGDATECRRLLERADWEWILPDVVVHVAADPVVCAAALRSRGDRQSRVEAVADADLPAAIREVSDQLDELTRWWLTRSSESRVRWELELDNPGDEGIAGPLAECAADLDRLRHGSGGMARPTQPGSSLKKRVHADLSGGR